MKTVTTAALVEQLDQLFASSGWPKVIVTDNGTQFMSSSFES